MFPQLHLYKWLVGGLFISPNEKVAISMKFHFSATDRTLITYLPDASSRPNHWSHDQLIGRCQRPVTCHRTHPVAFSPL